MSLLIILFIVGAALLCAVAVTREPDKKRVLSRPRVIPSSVHPSVTAMEPAAESISKDLLEHLNWTLAHTPAEERKQSRWVMDDGWFLDVRRIDMDGRLLYHYPRDVSGDFILYGLPVLLREGAGPPHLEPVPEEEVKTASGLPSLNKAIIEHLNDVDKAETIRAQKVQASLNAMNTTRDEYRKTVDYHNKQQYLQSRIIPNDLGSPRYDAYVEEVGIIVSADSPETLCRAVKNELEQYYKRQNNAYGAMVLPEGVQYTPLSHNDLAATLEALMREYVDLTSCPMTAAMQIRCNQISQEIIELSNMERITPLRPKGISTRRR